MTFALMAVPLTMLVGASIDVSHALKYKTELQDATDAAALAVSTAVERNPNLTVDQLQTMAQSYFSANFTQGVVNLTSFHVCAPVQNDCSSPGGAMTMNTIYMSAGSSSPCDVIGFASSLCSATGSNLPISTQTTAVIGIGQTIQVNVAMDSSASMIVGSTPADVTTISNWVRGHWNQVKPGDPGPSYPGGDNPPCAFACHDVGGSTTPADVALGLTHAHTAGATTRFDVMVAAAKQLITHLQTEYNNSTQLPRDSYVFNVFSFDTALHQYGGSNINFTSALTAVGTVTPGLDTYLSSAMTTLTSTVGSNGTGASTNSPLKFLILVTDGLQSDRNNNWACSSWAWDSAWNYNTCYGGYATGVSQSQCAQIKNNGIVLAVLETPYVPLTGQSPNVAPYEKTVRHVIFPGGPSSTSVISSALSSCASSGYYFQANNPTDIATGFISLTDKFIASTARLQN